MKDLSKKFKFSKEYLFQKALISLLSKMPNITEIQLLQGPLENGKDIVFKYPGPFGESINCACVVKNTKIVGQVNSSNAARIVMEQAKQALFNIYKDNSGTPLKINRVFVISSEHISPQAIESISGQLYERSGQIVFISGEELIRLFQNYWPNYLADEASAIERYNEEIKSALDTPNELMKLSELYPNYFNDINKLHYLPTGFCLTLQNYNIQSMLDIVPANDFFSQSISHADIDKVRERIENGLYFLKHLILWNYLDKDYLKRYLDYANIFFELLQQEWINGKQDEKSKITNIYGSEPEYKRLRSNTKLLEARDRLLNILLNSIQKIKSSLSKSHNLSKQDLSNSVNLCNNSELLEYLTSVECIESCKFITNLDNSNNSILRDYDYENVKLREYKGIFLISSPPGYGKTSYCRWSGSEDLRAWKASEEKYLPIYIKLNIINKKNLQGERQLLTAGLSTALLGEEDWHSVTERKFPIRLYLDGLDELSNYNLRKDVILLAKKIAESRPNWQIIITTRDYVRAIWLSGIVRVKLKGFSLENVKEYAVKMLYGHKHSSERFMEQLSSNKDLLSLSQVPLLTTLMVLVFRTTGSLPTKRANLYLIFIELLCGGWDLAKGIQRQVKYGSQIKIALLIRLACLTHQKRQRYFSIDTYYQACLNAAPSMFAVNNKYKLMENMLEELVNDGLLNRTGGTLQFTHLSFQEFMVAKGFTHNAYSGEAEDALIEYLKGDDWWQEVLFFLIGLGSSPESIADWIKSVSNKFPHYDVFVQEKKLFKELNDVYSWKIALR